MIKLYFELLAQWNGYIFNTLWGAAFSFSVYANSVGIELIGNFKINKPETGACLYYMKRLRIAIVAQSGAHPHILG